MRHLSRAIILMFLGSYVDMRTEHAGSHDNPDRHRIDASNDVSPAPLSLFSGPRRSDSSVMSPYPVMPRRLDSEGALVVAT